MSKDAVPLCADDLSKFSRALARELGPQSPSHLTLMNMLARAAGFRNVQHLRAAHAALRRLNREVEVPPIDGRAVEKTLHRFDVAGRLIAWPAKRSVQTLALWALWSSIPGGMTLSERDVNEHLNAVHLFGDPATLCRMMIGNGLLTRNTDCSEYRRIECEPTPEAKHLIRTLTARRRLHMARLGEPITA
ncbi:MAG: DUF2087 domain-containing protein [Rhodobacteraceae bacterium]|nr:DUF2087 domain-containing protein [Paracoccaceae bacterium]